jgi:hypothetical protein
MRELVQQSTSGSTELAASSEQMSKMSRGLLESLDRFSLEDASRAAANADPARAARRAAAAAHF